MDRTQEIKETLRLLEGYWTEHPELRLGQVVANASHVTTKNFDPFYMEDMQFRNFCKENLPNEDDD